MKNDCHGIQKRVGPPTGVRFTERHVRTVSQCRFRQGMYVAVSLVLQYNAVNTATTTNNNNNTGNKICKAPTPRFSALKKYDPGNV